LKPAENTEIEMPPAGLVESGPSAGRRAACGGRAAWCGSQMHISPGAPASASGCGLRSTGRAVLKLQGRWFSRRAENDQRIDPPTPWRGSQGSDPWRAPGLVLDLAGGRAGRCTLRSPAPVRSRRPPSPPGSDGCQALLSSSVTVEERRSPFLLLPFAIYQTLGWIGLLQSTFCALRMSLLRIIPPESYRFVSLSSSGRFICLTACLSDLIPLPGCCALLAADFICPVGVRCKRVRRFFFQPDSRRDPLGLSKNRSLLPDRDPEPGRVGWRPRSYPPFRPALRLENADWTKTAGTRPLDLT